MKIKTKKQAYDALQKILDFSSPKERREFAEMVISSDAMYIVKQLMDKNSMTEKELVKKLKISQKHLRDLFTGDKYITIELIAKLVEIFDIGFKIVTTDMVKK